MKVDPRSNLIQIWGSGLWSRAEVDAHFDELDGEIRQKRTRFPHIRVLVDIRESGVQTQDTAEGVTLGTRRIYREGDRIAIIVASSLVKMQMRRAVEHRELQIFISPSAAVTWLEAYDGLTAA